MAEETMNNPAAEPKKEQEVASAPKQAKPEEKKTSVPEKKETPKTTESKETKKKESSTTAKKKETPEVKPKESAIVNANNLRISPKQTKFICRMIRGKGIDAAMLYLEDVAKGKAVVKMTGLEVPHQKGKGIAGGRFPKTAATAVAKVVKQLGANCMVNGIENPVITLAIANQASAPYRRGGRKAKRTRLHLEARDKTKLIMAKK